MKPRWGMGSWATPVSQGSRCAATLGCTMGRFQRPAKAAHVEQKQTTQSLPTMPSFHHPTLNGPPIFNQSVRVFTPQTQALQKASLDGQLVFGSRIVVVADINLQAKELHDLA